MKGFTVFGVFVGFALLIVVSALLNGWVLSILWGWFIVPTFGLPKLSVVTAIGIALTVHYLTYQYHKEAKSEQDDELGILFMRSFLFVIFQPLLALMVGWVVHKFM